MTHNEGHLAEILSIEGGKPFGEALAEVRYATSFIGWYAGEAVRINGDVIYPPLDIAAHAQRQLLHVIAQPVGVVSAITPWSMIFLMRTVLVYGLPV